MKSHSWSIAHSSWYWVSDTALPRETEREATISAELLNDDRLRSHRQKRARLVLRDGGRQHLDEIFHRRRGDAYVHHFVDHAIQRAHEFGIPYRRYGRYPFEVRLPRRLLDFDFDGEREGAATWPSGRFFGRVLDDPGCGFVLVHAG